MGIAHYVTTVTSRRGGRPLCCNHRQSDRTLEDATKGMTMTTTALTAHTTSALWTSFLSALAAPIAELCAGARDGREIAARYDALARKSNSELATIGLTRTDITRAALSARRN